MAKGKPSAPKLPGSYELLAMRVQKIINSQSVQKAKAALLYRAEDETADDWAQILGEIAETDNVTVAHRDDGSVQIFWVVPKDD